jgi:hypothetical protein
MSARTLLPCARRGLVRISLATVGIALLAACGGTTESPSATVSATPSAHPSPIITPSSSPSPVFTWESRAATVEDLGSSWREGCPVGPESLVVVDLTYWTFEGTVATGELVLNQEIESQTQMAFHSLFELGFPIRSIINVDAFNSDDGASMAADNTSAFNCRSIAGTDDWSNHAFGRAIDVNPVENPYILNGDVEPPGAQAYVDRVEGPGLLVEGDAALEAFLDAGFEWGGSWRNPKDYQHLELPD